MTASALPAIDELLDRHGLSGVPEEPFPNDGWSGASMSLLRRPDGERFVLKRDSLAADWIARATADQPLLRECWFASAGSALPAAIRNPALGGGFDPSSGTCAILMPDLSGVLFDWDAPLPIEQLDRVLAALAALHRSLVPSADRSADAPWCPVRERVSLICRSSLERPGPARDAVAERILPGWDAFDRLATTAGRDVIARLSVDPGPLVRALQGRPAALLHGDLKLANAGLAADGAVEAVDWQMVMVAPVAIELGWFLVSNVNSLPLAPAAILDRYWLARPDGAADRQPEDDLAILVGLLLRGWRKGYDAEAGVTLGSGVSARDDLEWWCQRAVEAADRVL
jgi:hypothetical protein